MGRPKGLPKTGGRQKGTPNKVNRVGFKDALDDAGFNLIDELVQTLKQIPPTSRIHYLCEIIKFLYPTVKEAESQPDPNTDLRDKSTDDLLRIANG